MASLTKKPLALGTLGLVTFAALSFKQLDDLKPEIDLLMAPMGANFANPVAREAIVKVAQASLAAAGTQVSEDDLKSNLDTFNFPGVVSAIFERNGFLDEQPASASTGEAEAAASTS